MLKLQRVSASIAGITVLREIDVSLPPGQLLAVVGRNGAGKTTLLRAIMGLLPMSAGRITLDGIDLGARLDIVVRRWVSAMRRKIA